MKIVAEIGLSHEGSLGTALRMIDACADAGTDAVKFQYHGADPVSEFRPGTWFPQDKTRKDYWDRTNFWESDWRAIRQRCINAGVEYGVSCFSVSGFSAMASMAMPDFFKVPSGLTSNRDVFTFLSMLRCPVVLSTGMSDVGEIIDAVCVLRERPTVLQATSEYPCPPERVGLNVMAQLREMFGCKVGLSDHSGQIFPGIVAAYLGADMLEVHVCQSRWSFGPDVPASLTFDELKQLVAGVRFVERMTPVDKDEAAKSMDEMRAIFREATNA